MKDSVYIFKSGTLKRNNESLLFYNDEVKTHIPVENIKEIYVFGELNINKRLLEFLTKKEIILSFFNYYGYYIGSYYPREHYNSGYMIINQAKAYFTFKKRIFFAKKFVIGAVKNTLRILKYYNRRDIDLNDEIDKIKLKANEIKKQKTIESLMAVEGNIKMTYYSCFNRIIKKDLFKFSSRTKQPPKDHINALISFSNGLIYNYVLSEIYKTHLDPRIGFLHTANFRSFSLNLDIAEIFKPVIGDRTIFHVINKGIIGEKDFIKKSQGIFLNENGLKIFIENIQKRLNQTLKHSKLDKKVSYRRLIKLELYKIEKDLIGDEEYKPFIMDW